MRDVKDKLLAVLPKVKSGRVVMPRGSTPKDCPMSRGCRLKVGHHSPRCQPIYCRPISTSLQELAPPLRLPPLQEVKYKSSSYIVKFFCCFCFPPVGADRCVCPTFAVFLLGEHIGSPLHSYFTSTFLPPTM